MDFSFTDEQQMLKDSARRFFSERYPADKVVEVAESGLGPEPDSTREMAELGWVGLSVPEDAGGAGMSFVEEAVILEEAGYALFPGPLFSTIALAQPALALDADAMARITSGEAAGTLAWAEEGVGTDLVAAEWTTTVRDSSVSGSKFLVPDAGSCDIGVIACSGADGPELVAVSLTDAKVEQASTMDPTRPYSRVELDEVPGTRLVAGEDAAEVVADIRRRARVATALEAVGVAQRALDLARSHASERRQFDKAIGSYQAVSHQVADSYMGVELARSLGYWAAWCVAVEDERADAAAAAAKSYATEVAVAACERSIQVHGGVGFTWEHILHRYYKRAQWLESFDGYPASHRTAVADRLLGAR